MPTVGRRLSLLQNGFRPFFLGASLWAPTSLALWLATLAGAVSPPLALPPLAWHPHELLFGYAGAVIAGFLLTAVPNWTGRLPVRGAPLLGLWLVWLAARLANLAAARTPWLAAGLDVGFWALLVAAMGREVAVGRNWRNFPVIGLVALLTIACLLSQAEALGAATGPLGRRLALAAILVLIGLIGGRVVPSFTRNWLAKRAVLGLPAPFDRMDRAALAVLVVAVGTWVTTPNGTATAVLLTLAGFAALVRLARWHGWATRAEPLVTVLHLGYAWLGIGLVLVGLGSLFPDSVGRLATVHALTTGAIGTMTLAIMTRATLGHTGRALTADAVTVAVYVLVQAGAAMRVLSPVLPLDYNAALVVAGLLWGGAFLLYALRYGPMLLERRVAMEPD
jgi:uncharacterized protein involved in response to NO